MKVDAYGNIKASTPLKKRSGISASGTFLSALDAAEAITTGFTEKTGEIAATSSLAGMLALQEISDEETRHKKLIKQGKEMLDTLEQLRRQLLIGAIPLSMLGNIEKQLKAQKQTVSDPKLIEIIDEIELRAAVELAKLEMAAKTEPPPLSL